MIIYAADDEPSALRLLSKAIVKAAPKAVLRTFSEPEDMIEAAAVQPCDVAFLDVEMGRMTGLELARALRERKAAANVVFVTAYDRYACDAYKLFASGYIVKPVTHEAVSDQLANLRVPVEDDTHKVEVKTFGNFDMLVDGEPVHFTRSKSKEILAYLVDKRGTSVTTSELACALWGDAQVDARRKNKYVNVLVNSMRSDLEAVGAGGVVARSGGELSVVVDSFECDLYALLQDGGVNGVAYTGHYMSRYSWAEVTKAYLDLNY